MRVSFEVTRSAPSEPVEKAAPLGLRDAGGSPLPKGAQPAGDLAPLAAQLATETPATGQPPNPGPTPQASPDPTPLRWQFPYAVNFTQTPRGESNRLTPFAVLRQLAEVADLVRIAIEARKDQMTALTWDFAPRVRSHGRKPTAAEEATIKRLRAFFRRPDRLHGWNTWMRMAIEEVLVIDALSIYRRRTRGGGPYALEIIDGTTIKPLLNSRGFTPAPPSAAYRQIINGQAVAGGDCSTEQLFYRPRTVRTWTPYGLSATECVMLTVNTALNRQVFNLGYYAEGNVPEGLVSVPEGWSVDQIRQFQDYWDALIAGNYRNRQRLRFVGPKMAESVYQFKKESFDTKFDEWLLQVVCAAFGVQPQELGFTQQINKSQGEQQENVTYRRGVKPLGHYLKDILDETIAEDHDAADFEAIFTGAEAEDRLSQAKIDVEYVKIGKVSVDELRARDGEEMIGLGPMVWTNEGPVFVEQLIIDKDHNPLTSRVREVAAPSSDLSEQNTDEARQRKTGRVPVDDAPDVEGDEATAKAIDGELATFRRYVGNRVAKGKGLETAAAGFESTVLPLALREQLVGAIITKAAGSRPTLGDVAATFEIVEKAAAPKRLKVQAQAKYKKFLSGYFADLGDALGAHLAAAAETSE